MVPSICMWIYVSVKSFFLSVHTIPGLVFQRIFSASVIAGIGVYLGRHIYVCPCLCGPLRDSEYKPIPYQADQLVESVLTGLFLQLWMPVLWSILELGCLGSDLICVNLGRMLQLSAPTFLFAELEIMATTLWMSEDQKS